jgi:hypothetical protein
VGVEYLVLWLRVETQTTLVDEDCGMDVFLSCMTGAGPVRVYL